MTRSHGQDRWIEWLIRRRSGGGKDGHIRAQRALKPTRDRILENAKFLPTDIVLDLGSGDGFIGLAALGRLGPHGKVIFSDISQPCLDYISEAVRQLGEAHRAEFIHVSADALNGVADASVDVVTARSVLIYVKAKQTAFNEAFRVLRPGGRISISEPVDRDVVWMKSVHKNEFDGYDAGEFAHLLGRMNAEDVARLDEDPLTDFSHRDLVTYCETAGFSQVHVELKIDITPRSARTWDEYIHAAPTPNTPAIGEVFQRYLSKSERSAVESHLRPLVERGIGVNRRAVAYISATK